MRRRVTANRAMTKAARRRSQMARSATSSGTEVIIGNMMDSGPWLAALSLTWVPSLPGNPASSLVTFYLLGVPALRRLAARFPILGLTNGNAELSRVGLAPFFVASIAALEVGVSKPDPRIFRAAAEAVGVHPHEVLHVGDDAHLDGVGGLGAGMQFAWVNRAGHDWAHAPHQPHLTVADLQTLVDRLV